MCTCHVFPQGVLALIPLMVCVGVGWWWLYCNDQSLHKVLGKAYLFSAVVATLLRAGDIPQLLKKKPPDQALRCSMMDMSLECSL